MSCVQKVTQPHAPPYRRNRTQASHRTGDIVAVMASHCLTVKAELQDNVKKKSGKNDSVKYQQDGDDSTLKALQKLNCKVGKQSKPLIYFTLESVCFQRRKRISTKLSYHTLKGTAILETEAILRSNFYFNFMFTPCVCKGPVCKI